MSQPPTAPTSGTITMVTHTRLLWPTAPTSAPVTAFKQPPVVIATSSASLTPFTPPIWPCSSKNLA
uniref:Uncharacterized protein n=1 Tax=Romanomermis culicivorax TaxID=13658 RepID=A0A915K971_ROMCU